VQGGGVKDGGFHQINERADGDAGDGARVLEGGEGEDGADKKRAEDPPEEREINICRCYGLREK
jgi:hypothetical protein